MEIPGLSRPSLSYLVCATPRSGSTLLCKALEVTGCAGHPEERPDADRLHHRPRARLPGCEGHAHRPRHRRQLAGIETPEFAQGTSLMPLVRGETENVRDEIFGELTYHAAYEPQRAVRTKRFKYIRYYSSGGPVLANVDDSTTKELMIRLGWADRPVDRERLYDLPLDPNEMRNVADEPACQDVRARLSERLDSWMRETSDPLLDGDVPAPPGARINTRDQRSAEEDPIVVGSEDQLPA